MRIKIRDDKTRELFFELIRQKLVGNWKDVRVRFDVPRSSFDKYRSGENNLPENLFYKFIQCLDKKQRDYLLSKIEKLPDNFGAIKGGKAAYIINFDKFIEGRKKGAKSIRKKRNAENISFDSLTLSSQICEFAGAFIGDGCFNSYKNKLYHIEFAGDRRYDLPYYNEIIIPIVKKVIHNINPHIYSRNPKENAIRIVFYSKRLFVFLNKFLGFTPGKKAFTVKIPNKIIKSDDRLIRATIRGIFDTDGGVFLDKRKMYKIPYPRIVFQTVSKPLYEQLQDYLSKRFTLYTGFNPKRQVYIIEIYGIKQLERWMSLIGFSNKRHLDRLAHMPQ